MKRFAKYLLIGIGTLLVLLVLAIWAASKGITPLIGGVQIANGAVIVVADKSTGPVAAAAYLFPLKDGGLGLIDSTMDPEARAIRMAITRLGKTYNDVRVILFTHSHDDHTAGARAFPNADVYLLKPFVTATQGGSSGDSLLNKFQGLKKGSKGTNQPNLKSTHYLSDGEHLDLHGTPVEVFAVPGHTYDSAAFLVHGVLFLGDSAAAQYDGKIGAAPPVVSVDRKLNRQSLKALADRLKDRQGEIGYLAFGHQGPLKGLDPLLEWASNNK